MTFTRIFNFKNFAFLLIGFGMLSMVSCGDDDTKVLENQKFSYALHNGQTVPSAPYGGTHPIDFAVEMDLQELESGGTLITMNLMNTISGATYRLHAHDSADAATTPNGTPYDESPNGEIFAQMVEGNGNTVSVSQETSMTVTELTTNYSGFFVVHDPLQTLSTVDISTYLVVGGFARQGTNPSYESTTFNYDFNTGQVAAAFAYDGLHNDNLTAQIKVDELAEGSRVTVSIMNSLDGQIYNTHAHDMANSADTPNGTPYNEAPNVDVFASPIMGVGGTARATKISSLSFNDLTTNYDGFFVIHDPLQDLSTVDPTTYVILGIFAR